MSPESNTEGRITLTSPVSKNNASYGTRPSATLTAQEF
jgi:hypothetical protein